jgi:hypothetical protein
MFRLQKVPKSTAKRIREYSLNLSGYENHIFD